MTVAFDVIVPLAIGAAIGAALTMWGLRNDEDYNEIVRQLTDLKAEMIVRDHQWHLYSTGQAPRPGKLRVP